MIKLLKTGLLKGKLAAHNPHNPKVGGSSPSSATKSPFYRHLKLLFKTLDLF